MAINHRDYSKALSVLASAPRKIAEAQEKCRQQIAAVDAKDKNLWAPATLERERAAANKVLRMCSTALSFRNMLHQGFRTGT